MGFREIYQMAFRSSTGTEDLKRIAESELSKYSGQKKIKLVGALLFNAKVCNCEDEVNSLIMKDLFEKDGILSFRLPDLENILSCIISSGYCKKFVEYMQDFDERIKDDEWFEIAEKYNILAAEYGYENDEKPILIDLDYSETSSEDDE